MTREKYAVQFVSRRLAEFKKGSRDPGQYRPPVSSLGETRWGVEGSEVHSVMGLTRWVVGCSAAGVVYLQGL